ncbi:hypothetical protein ACA910_014226 [Epithemia clementina (nom. ined.)]
MKKHQLWLITISKASIDDSNDSKNQSNQTDSPIPRKAKLSPVNDHDELSVLRSQLSEQNECLLKTRRELNSTRSMLSQTRSQLKSCRKELS